MSRKKKAVAISEIQRPAEKSPVIEMEPLEETGTVADGHAEASFPIVGIGASAGGLAAFEGFFAAMPPTTESGMAIVLVQHLAPDHKSILSDLVKRYTQMQVSEVEDGMVVQPNCAYIIPPNRDMAFLDGKLHLLEPSAPRGLRLPIDFFFRSLARDQHERAICIVLSGTGSDGTLGVRAIKGEGGMTMAQTPDSTEYDGMPRSAIATGLVDFVLPPGEMPAQLIRYVNRAFGQKSRAVSVPPTKAEDALQKIFVLLRAQTRHDFSQYKQNTIARRVERRMAVQQVEQLDEYVRYLQQSPAEVEALFHELLIGVTSFFRDPEAFSALAAQAIPRLFAGKPAGAVLRAWVPGCSTGEEAYSLAMLFQEQMEALKQNFRLQIFATDIDPRAITQARAGSYPASIAADVSPERLARFFVQDQDDSGYRIQKSIRDMLVISEQNMIQAPPFSRLDLISCRNLLIYMSGDLQKKLIPLFHYALNPNGLLFLGSSETVGDFVYLFTTLDRKWKLYQRQEDLPGALRPGFGPFLPSMTRSRAGSRSSGKVPNESKPPLRELTEQALLHEFTPASVLVNAQGDILYIHGRTGRYLEPAQGEAGLNIVAMARAGLQEPLSTALHKAAADHAPVCYPGLRVRSNGESARVNLTVQPLAARPAGDEVSRIYLVVFEEVSVTTEGQDAGKERLDSDGAARIVALEEELRARDDYLYTTREQMETANEELKSINEELQSVNEELQSTNEELETAKEEMQSVNEELATVNAELQQRIADLSRANNDMNNLLAATDIGTIFLDKQLRIRRFTPAASRLINLIASDAGRPVGHIVSNLVGYTHLLADVQAVLDSLAPKEVEVQTQTGAWYLLSIRPYRTLENVFEGAVITFVDITRMKKAESVYRLATVVRDSRDVITLQDFQGRILAWNPAAERIYGWSEVEALAMNVHDLIPQSWRAHEVAIRQQLARSEVLEPYRGQRVAKDGRILAVSVIATALVNDAGEVYAFATTERETEQKNRAQEDQ